ncbi:hypothetical protein ACLFMI_26490 [Pseudonocardia nantongensis]|uniref:hypothetical protein n=1 Tax=Pseudonocardia nantongensis TaxID=1181885 RepID=UPI0039798B60
MPEERGEPGEDARGPPGVVGVPVPRDPGDLLGDGAVAQKATIVDAVGSWA